MNTPVRIAAALVLLTGAAGALAAGGDRALVAPSQPHAVISTALPPGPSHYAVKIVWLDGNYLSSQGRRSALWVKPGPHEIGFRAIINTDRGPAVMSTPAMSGPENLQTLKIDLEQGYTYYFAADVPNANASKWRPVLLKKEKGG